jgi:methionine sulfoxide reductase heme-binding subunit
MVKQTGAQPPNQLGRPLGTGRAWRRRLLLHHLPLGLASAALLVVFMNLPPFTDTGFALLDMGSSSPLPATAGYGGHQGGGRTIESAFTLATGYVATVLLALTLLIGPANLLLGRRTPVSTSLARDTGVWAAILGIVHVIVGLKVHGNSGDLFNFVNYFFRADGTPKTNSFGLGNWVGLAALIIVVGLLALSNDRSLRELKAKRWKNLQRTNYALFALVVLHAFFYGAFLRTTSPFTLVLIGTVIAVLIGQAVGIRLWHGRFRRTRSADAQQPEAPQPTGSTR